MGEIYLHKKVILWFAEEAFLRDIHVFKKRHFIFVEAMGSQSIKSSTIFFLAVMMKET